MLDAHNDVRILLDLYSGSDRVHVFHILFISPVIAHTTPENVQEYKHPGFRFINDSCLEVIEVPPSRHSGIHDRCASEEQGRVVGEQSTTAAASVHMSMDIDQTRSYIEAF